MKFGMCNNGLFSSLSDPGIIDTLPIECSFTGASIDQGYRTASGMDIDISVESFNDLQAGNIVYSIAL
jgi:hypothetical protein